MVRLTTAYVEKKCSQTQASKSLTKELKKNHLRKITHLYMNDKFINAIGNFAACRNLRVVYLHNNCISTIENLHFAINITHLYLQHNNISKIENLDCLRSLKSLFLGYNNICVIEGLENLENLKELSVERQKISSGESLYFDPRSCQTLALSLSVLNITGNKMTTLIDIANFQMLESLEAKDNCIEDIKDLTETVKSLRKLRQLFLQDNPVTKCYRYRENIIANTDSLACLDGKDISPISRQFMKKFKIERHLQQTTKKSKMTLSDDITSLYNLFSRYFLFVELATCIQEICYQSDIPAFWTKIIDISNVRIGGIATANFSIMEISNVYQRLEGQSSQTTLEKLCQDETESIIICNDWKRHSTASNLAKHIESNGKII